MADSVGDGVVEPDEEPDDEPEPVPVAEVLALWEALGRAPEAVAVPEGVLVSDELTVGARLPVLEPDAPSDTLLDGVAEELGVPRGLPLRVPVALAVCVLAAETLGLRAGDCEPLRDVVARGEGVPAGVPDRVGD